MAAKRFIVDIDLTKKQLLNAVIQNLATAPGTPFEGQIYYNTADLKVYGWNGTAWIDMFGAGGNYVHPTFTAFAPTLTGANVLASFTTTTEGHVDTLTTRLLTLEDLGYVPYTHPNDGVDLGVALTGAAVISDVNVNALGHVVGFATRNMTAADIGAAIINDAVTNTTDTWSSSKIEAEITAALSGVPTPTIGGYDVATNTPNLETPGAGTIKKGDIYVATTAGDFFTETLSVGDTLIAKIDNPAVLGDWIRIERNIQDILPATKTDVGISRFATQAEVDAGTLANIGVDPTTLAARLAALTLLKKFSTNIGDGTATSFTITHNLNTTDVDVTVKEGTSNIVVDWTTPSVNTIVVNVNSAPGANAYRVTVIG